MSVTTSCICHAWERPAQDHAPSCPQAPSPFVRPAASAAEADLREQVFGTVAVWHSTLPVEHLQSLADAVLALPALQRLAEQAAEAARLRVTVERVRLYADLLDDDMRTLGYADGHPAAKAIRELLDGTDA